MSRPANEIVHATCVALGDAGVLLTGPPGSGKSDLALRLIDDVGRTPAALLVADDRTVLCNDQGRIHGAPPPTIAGRLEVRGVGILAVPHRPQVEIALVVELVARADMPRLPDHVEATLCGIAVPAVKLHAFDASAPARLRAALAALAPGRLAEDIARD